jgi:hypothetical protein
MNETTVETLGLGSAALAGDAENENVRQHNESMSCDEHGIITLTEVWQGDYIGVCKFAQKKKNSKTMPDLLRHSWGAQKLEGNQGRASIVYKGVKGSFKSAKFRINVGTRSEPIELHPYFSKGKKIPDGTVEYKVSQAKTVFGYKFGGDVISGKQGSDNASFTPSSDGTGKVFSHFSDKAGFNLQGVVQFTTSNVVVNAVYVSDHNFTDPSDLKLGKSLGAGGVALRIGQWFENIPGCDLDAKDFYNTIKGDEKNHSWLCTRANTEIIGSALRQDCDFLLSGPLGWNPLIYPASSMQGSFPANLYSSL